MLRSTMRAGGAGVRTIPRRLLVEHVEEGGRELVDVPVGVDIRGRLD
jgi:hypothetical protein